MVDTEFRAAHLAKLLQSEVFDADDAAKFLGIERNSIEYAAYRQRIDWVQYGAKKLYTRADLLDYASKRGRGRDSRLGTGTCFVVKPSPSGRGGRQPVSA